MEEQPRVPFTARAEVIRENISAIALTQVTELSLYGCYLEFTSDLEKGTHVLVRISAGSDFFEAKANVVYSRPNLGTCLVFSSIEPHFVGVLKKWLSARP